MTDDKAAYPAWLAEVYGPNPPKRDKWVTYEDIRPKLATWSVKDFDASPLMDQWSFNDSYWNNFVGDLVEYSNKVDPATPCGYVGGQCPNAFGGYDYAKLMKKVQFLEAYNIGGAQGIVRSFNPHNAIPTVTTHFHRTSEDTAWQTWYYLAHGNKGFVGWVEGWFDGKTPKAWHADAAPHFKQAGEKIGPLMTGAEWVHDGIAIYYSHPSIQLSWVMDAAAHGQTWVNRNGDDRLGSSHQVRKAWENMLRDSGLQYSYVGYADVIAAGIPKEYKVLILPACLCLSDIEAKRIREFAEAGGTVIADYLPGVWDQHGKGRPAGGALDDLFGVKHSPDLTPADLFAGGSLWCELDQDKHFEWKTYKEFLGVDNKCVQEEGFDKAVRKMPVNTTAKAGKGTAVLLNLSPQWYNAHREAGPKAAAKRGVFMTPVEAAAGKRWVQVGAAKDAAWGCEVTYWKAGDRTLAVRGDEPGDGGEQHRRGQLGRAEGGDGAAAAHVRRQTDRRAGRAHRQEAGRRQRVRRRVAHHGSGGAVVRGGTTEAVKREVVHSLREWSERSQPTAQTRQLGIAWGFRSVGEVGGVGELIRLQVASDLGRHRGRDRGPDKEQRWDTTAGGEPLTNFPERNLRGGPPLTSAGRIDPAFQLAQGENPIGLGNNRLALFVRPHLQ